MLRFGSVGRVAQLRNLRRHSLSKQSFFFLGTLVVSALFIYLFAALNQQISIWPVLLPTAFAGWVWRTKAAWLLVFSTAVFLLIFSFFTVYKVFSSFLFLDIFLLIGTIFVVRLVDQLDSRVKVLSVRAKSFEVAAELSEEPIEMTLPNGRIEFINSAWEKLTGFTKKEALGLPLDSLLRTTKRESKEHTSLEDALKLQEIWRGELQNRHKDDRVISLKASVSGIFEDGELASIVSIKNDLREEKEITLELRAFHALPDIVFSVDFEGHLLSFKAPYDPSRKRSLAVVLGMSLLVAIPSELMPEDIAHRIFQLSRRALQTGEMETFEYVLEGVGKRPAYEARLIPNQEEEEVLVVIRDISKRKQLERALELAQLSFRNIIERNQDGSIIIDDAGIVRFTSPAAQRYLRGQGVRLGQLFDFPLLVGTSTEIEIVRSIQDDGAEVMGIGEMQVMKTKWVGDVAYLASIRDITERKYVEKKLVFQAFHDLLTGMPNRAFLLDRLGHLLAERRSSSHVPFAILFMDLDRFKNVNDSLGHHAGDQLLVEISSRLQNCMRGSDIVARLGGDEFVILLEKCFKSEDAMLAAERVQHALKDPFLLKGHEIFSSASIGIALSSGDYSQPEELLRDADTAMYHAKELGKSRYVVFDKQMHHHALLLLRLENDLKRAVEQNEFVLFFQPILNLNTHLLEGFEVLVRWNHPTDGLLAPGAFLEVAEDTGLLVPIGWWVMREACRQMRVWQLQFPEHPLRSMSVNLSAGQLAQQDFVARVLQILRETGLPPKALKLEITEGALIERVDVATSMLESLREQKVQVHMDDFGTGYSSLSYLQTFPVDALKIDRSFVSDMNERGENTEIVQAIVSMAHSLGLSITAEGAEHPFQVDLLRDFGCERVQGYIVSRPVNAQSATMMVQHPDWYKKKHPVPKDPHPITRNLTVVGRRTFKS